MSSLWDLSLNKEKIKLIKLPLHFSVSSLVDHRVSTRSAWRYHRVYPVRTFARTLNHYGSWNGWSDVGNEIKSPGLTTSKVVTMATMVEPMVTTTVLHILASSNFDCIFNQHPVNGCWDMGNIIEINSLLLLRQASQIAKFMGPTWGPPGSWPQMGSMLTPSTLL